MQGPSSFRLQPLTASVIQLNSQDDVANNLDLALLGLRRARERGARLCVLPENFAFMGPEEQKRAAAEILGEGPISRALQDEAKRLGVWIIAGGMPERSHDAARPYNTAVVISPEGRIVSTYRKMHLFDVALGDGTVLRESDATGAGSEPVVVDIEGVVVGVTICYDVRFPELYRRLGDMGARVVVVPAAFTLTTGKDHWLALLRARAIENQVFVLAAAQWGIHPRNRRTYGKSVIIDPWGDTLAQVGEGLGEAVAPLDFAYQDRVRAELPCLQHRVIR